MSDVSPAAGGPYEPAASPRPIGTDWMSVARQAFEAGEPQRAIYAAREALAADGRNAEAWAIRARSSFALDRFQDAEFEAREAVGFAPQIAVNHEILASVYEVQERYADAVREAEEAVRLDPRAPQHRAVLGSIYVSRGTPREAIKVYEQLVREVPGEPLYRRFLAEALNRTAFLSWTGLPDGSRVITAASQASLTRDYGQRALALEFRDDELRRDIRENVTLANQAESKRWMHARPILLRLYIAAVAVLLFFGLVSLGVGKAANAAVGLFALLIAGGIIAIYVLRHRKFVWEHDAETARQVIGGR